MDTDNLISVYLKLLSVLECPVCLDYLTKPVGLCNGGHAICSKCKVNLRSCPLCRNPMSGIRGLIVDQVIDTLLYPCYKMGCGSLLKRSEAENHDQTCEYEAATDRQTVLHNNLLQNVEDNFSSFFVHPQEVKETRTVGTVTGKVKVADARVQTAIPFSVKMSPMDTISGDSRSPFKKSKPTTTGVSISCPSDASKLEFSFPQSSLFGLNSLLTCSDNVFNDQQSCSKNTPLAGEFRYNMDSSPMNRVFWNTQNFDQMSQPFSFTSNLENSPFRSSPRKPSTSLNINHETDTTLFANNLVDSNPNSFNMPGIGNFTFQAYPLDSAAGPSSFASINPLPVHSSEAGSQVVDDNPNVNRKPRIRPSTNLCVGVDICPETSLNNHEPLNNRIVSNNNRRPTTNLCTLTTPA